MGFLQSHENKTGILPFVRCAEAQISTVFSGKATLNLDFYIPSQTITSVSSYSDGKHNLPSKNIMDSVSHSIFPTVYWQTGSLKFSKSNEVQGYRSDFLTLCRGSQELNEKGKNEGRSSRWQRLGMLNQKSRQDGGCSVLTRPASSGPEKQE